MSFLIKLHALSFFLKFNYIEIYYLQMSGNLLLQRDLACLNLRWNPTCENIYQLIYIDELDDLLLQ